MRGLGIGTAKDQGPSARPRRAFLFRPRLDCTSHDNCKQLPRVVVSFKQENPECKSALIGCCLLALLTRHVLRRPPFWRRAAVTALYCFMEL